MTCLKDFLIRHLSFQTRLEFRKFRNDITQVEPYTIFEAEDPILRSAICDYDSGGFIGTSEEGQRAHIFGITSYTLDESVACRVGGFTNVRRFLNWMRDARNALFEEK